MRLPHVRSCPDPVPGCCLGRRGLTGASPVGLTGAEKVQGRVAAAWYCWALYLWRRSVKSDLPP